MLVSCMESGSSRPLKTCNGNRVADYDRDDDAINTEEKIWDLTHNINVKGVWYGCKHAVIAMRKVCISSGLPNHAIIRRVCAHDHRTSLSLKRVSLPEDRSSTWHLSSPSSVPPLLSLHVSTCPTSSTTISALEWNTELR